MPCPRPSIRAKLLGGSLLIIVACAVGFALAVIQLGSVKRSSVALHDRAYVPTVAADAIRYHVKDLALQNANYAVMVAQVGTVAAEANTKQIAKLNAAVAADQKAIAKALPDLAAGPPALQSLGRRIVKASAEYNAALDAVHKASDAKVAAAVARMEAATAQLDDTTADYVAASGRFAAQAVDEVDAAYDHGRTIVLLALLIASCVGLAIGMRLSGSVRRGVADIAATLRSLRDHDVAALREGLDAVAHGDLTRPAHPVTSPLLARTGDEVGQIAGLVDEIRRETAASLESYNASIDGLGAMIGHVSQSATTLAGASEQMAAMSRESGRAVGEIATAVEDVAAGAERQAKAAADARRLTNTMTEAIDASARTTEDTGRSAGAARDLAADGAAAVALATEAMAAVREASAEATVAIRALGSKSEQIGGIVDTITTIAEQTNLLALNAAIEAARAGEHGRGFAVVAAEVRTLAEESQSAASSIADLIREIQAETSRAVAVVELGAERTEQGSETVEQARAAFERINGQVDEMTARVDDIAASVAQLATTSQDMAREISDVAAVSERTSATTEEVATATEQTSATTQQIAASADMLAATADELTRLVGKFKLAV